MRQDQASEKAPWQRYQGESLSVVEATVCKQTAPNETRDEQHPAHNGAHDHLAWTETLVEIALGIDYDAWISEVIRWVLHSENNRANPT